MFEETVSAIPSSLWSSMNSWFTPTVLFVLLNLMIGTIALTSTSFSNQKHPQNDPNQPKSPSLLHRLKSFNSPSNHHRSHEPQTLTPPHKSNPENSETHFAQNLETHFFQQASQQNLQIFEHNHEIKPQETQTQIVFEQTQIVFEQSETNPDDFTRVETIDEEEELQSMDEVYSQLTGSHFSRTKSDTAPSSGEIPAKLPAKMRKSASMKSPFGHFVEEDIVETRRPATVRERGNAKVTDGDEEVDAKADDFINKFKQQLKLQRLDSIIRYKDMIGRGSGR